MKKTPQKNTPITVDLLTQYQNEPATFRSKQYLEAVESLLANSSEANEAQVALSIAAREQHLWHMRENLHEIASKHHEALGNDENYNILLAMNGKDTPKGNELAEAWRLVAHDSTTNGDAAYQQFQKANVNQDFENEQIYHWLQVLSFSESNIPNVNEIATKLRKQLDSKFDKRQFSTDAALRKTYFNKLQRIVRYEFDALFEACMRSVDSIDPKEAPFKSLSNDAFNKWYEYTTNTFFFKSLRYSKTKELKKQLKRSGKDEAVQVYYQDLVPSSYIFTKSIILLAKFQHWEEAAYLYQEARQRPIGMRPVSLYSEAFYEVAPHIRRYITWGHVNPLQFNIGKMFDHGKRHRRRVLDELTEMMESPSKLQIEEFTSSERKVEAV
eukprot:CAMPEP_0117445976 /NCGR_PEP_ID=MMETSP0759-20121206/6088_1 /TAXON_ID=63605 /ORGANISM="Percolomonas cosmopolitus, Strain WS" /LENGTH=383 /DNA_ID=CAMNT_0005238199 /DNA_START=124 /DNA_END=1275 /DNA_ORIENTATION=+